MSNDEEPSTTIIKDKNKISPTDYSDSENGCNVDNSISAMRARVAKMQADSDRIMQMSKTLEEESKKKNKDINEKNINNNNNNNSNNNNSNNNNNNDNSNNIINNNINKKNENNSTIDEKEQNNSESNVEKKEQQEDLDTRSIFVNNVDYSANTDSLKQYFSSCGSIERITIVCDKYTGKPKGCAYVQFKSKEAIPNALLLDGKEFKGRTIKVEQKRTNLPYWMRSSRGRVRGRSRGIRRGYYRGGYYGYSRGGYRGRGYWHPYM